METANAFTITDAIINEMSKASFDTYKLIGLSFDGANVMSGFNSGVQRRISDTIKRQIPFVHCFSHQLNLTVLEIVGQNTSSVRTFDLAEQLYVFFRRLCASSKYEGNRFLYFNINYLFYIFYLIYFKNVRI